LGVIEYHNGFGSGGDMKHLSFSFMALMLSTTIAQAACYADYKAKQDGPLRLHYGVAEIRGDCSIGSAENQLRDRLAGDGWQLLNVLGVFDDAGLDERKDSAGDYFLRY
jgi:hypothetical protein